MGPPSPPPGQHFYSHPANLLRASFPSPISETSLLLNSAEALRLVRIFLLSVELQLSSWPDSGPLAMAKTYSPTVRRCWETLLSEWGVTDRAPRFPRLRGVLCYAVLGHTKMPPKYFEVCVGLHNKPFNCQYPRDLFPLPCDIGPSSGLPDTCAASYLPVANCQQNYPVSL